MGMYTGLKLHVQLKDETHDDVFDVLLYLFAIKDAVSTAVRNGKAKELLDCDRTGCGIVYGSSAYLDSHFGPDSWLNCHELHVQFNIKNYDSEIEKFLSWLSPWVSELKVGEYQYEEMVKPAPIIFEGSVLKIDFSGGGYYD